MEKLEAPDGQTLQRSTSESVLKVSHSISSLQKSFGLEHLDTGDLDPLSIDHSTRKFISENLIYNRS